MKQPDSEDEIDPGEDYDDVDDEGADGYRKGGYHPVAIGDTYSSRYIVVDKLGWGHFSTVWMAYDTIAATIRMQNSSSNTRSVSPRSLRSVSPRALRSISPRALRSSSPSSIRSLSPRARRSASLSDGPSPSRPSTTSSTLPPPLFVALKIQKSAQHYREAARDEIELLRSVSKACMSPKVITEFGKNYVPPIVMLYDYFDHVGPNGNHVCMTFEILGDNLLSMIKKYNYHGTPIHIVKPIVKQILEGMDFLHRFCNIIHTDLKPENILATTKETKSPYLASYSPTSSGKDDLSSMIKPQYWDVIQNTLQPKRSLNVPPAVAAAAAARTSVKSISSVADAKSSATKTAVGSKDQTKRLIMESLEKQLAMNSESKDATLTAEEKLKLKKKIKKKKQTAKKKDSNKKGNVRDVAPSRPRQLSDPSTNMIGIDGANDFDLQNTSTQNEALLMEMDSIPKDVAIATTRGRDINDDFSDDSFGNDDPSRHAENHKDEYELYLQSRKLEKLDISKSLLSPVKYPTWMRKNLLVYLNFHGGELKSVKSKKSIAPYPVNEVVDIVPKEEWIRPPLHLYAKVPIVSYKTNRLSSL